MGEIVERLRLQAQVGLFGTPKGHQHVSYGEAAEHIEQLQARVRELEPLAEMARRDMRRGAALLEARPKPQPGSE